MPIKIEPPVLYLGAGPTHRVVIGEASGRPLSVPEVFTALFEVDPAGAVEIDVETEAGKSRVTAVRVVELERRGVTGLTVGRLPIGDLLVAAVDRMARMGSGGAPTLAAARSASRQRVSGDRLAKVAAAYREGGIAAVIEVEPVSERQAFRLVARARAAGLLDEDGGR